MLNETNLHDYQVEAVEHIIDNSFAGLFLDMGLGKTVSTLTAINKLIHEYFEVTRVLIIAPKRVTENVWSSELEKWSHISLRISKIIGSPKQRLAALAADADVYLLGRDNVAWMCGEYGGSMLPFDMLVIDESSSFKNHKSQRFKALKMVQPSFDRVAILTGTPAPNGLIDLWPQMYLLDRGERLGKTITQYRSEYFTPGMNKGHVVYNYNIKDTSESRIYDKINDICMSMKAEDYLKLPGVNINPVEIYFDEGLKQQYEDFEREKVLEILDAQEGEISAMNAAALSNKLLQFANGAIYDEDKNVHPIHDLKLDAAEEIVEQAGGKPVLMAYTFQHDRDRLMHRLKRYKPRQLKTEQDIKDWNAGIIQVLIMHPASGGHGLNLQAGGNIIVWFGQTWSLELYQQFNARLNRQGQKAKVFIHRLIVRGTVDDKAVAAIDRKDKGQEGLMQAVKAIIRKYEKHFAKKG